jgi:hypothetical protein
MTKPLRPDSDRRCACGAALWWEHRETPNGKRWLALCESPQCGEFDPEPESILQTFLSGDDQPPEREPVHEWDFNA